MVVHEAVGHRGPVPIPTRRNGGRRRLLRGPPGRCRTVPPGSDPGPGTGRGAPRPLPGSAMSSERGSLSLFALVIATALFGAAGLVIDGAAGISAASRASDIAEDAARAGALTGSKPDTSGLVGVDESGAREAAAAWLAREG